MNNLLFFSAIFWGSAFVALLNSRLSIQLARRGGWVDYPNQRSLHSDATPRLGGLGIVLTFCLALLIVGLRNKFYFQIESNGSFYLAMLAGGLLLATVGFYDDIKTVNSGIKFLFQILAAIVVVVFANESASFQNLPPFIPAFAVFLLMILWVVGFCNVYNFMDGINGLSGSTGIIYGISLSLFALQRDEPNMAIMSMIVSGCCLGFLFMNFPRARTFMGDCGSLFLGFFFAVVIVRLFVEGANPIALGLVVSVYIFDSGFTIVRRLFRRQNIFAAHRAHLYQRLVLVDVDQKYVTLLYVIVQTSTAFLAFYYGRIPHHWRIVMLATLGFVFFAFSQLVSRMEYVKTRFLP